MPIHTIIVPTYAQNVQNAIIELSDRLSNHQMITNIHTCVIGSEAVVTIAYSDSNKSDIDNNPLSELCNGCGKNYCSC